MCNWKTRSITLLLLCAIQSVAAPSRLFKATNETYLSLCFQVVVEGCGDGVGRVGVAAVVVELSATPPGECR